MKSKRQGKGNRNRNTGLFITFEGTEGSGKSTQCRRLARTLRARGYQVLETREPGGTPMAEAIRRLLLARSRTTSNQETITPACETALILAARSQHVFHVIQPALQKGMVVLCDRFFDSTLAYQGYGRHLDTAFLTHSHQFMTGGLTPHLTFLLDLPIQEGLTRRRKSKQQNRLDQEALDFHQRVRRGFIALAKHHPQRIHKLDARQAPNTLTDQITAMTTDLIDAQQSGHLAPSILKSTRTIQQAHTKGTSVHGVSRYRRTSTTN